MLPMRLHVVPGRSALLHQCQPSRRLLLHQASSSQKLVQCTVEEPAGRAGAPEGVLAAPKPVATCQKRAHPLVIVLGRGRHDGHRRCVLAPIQLVVQVLSGLASPAADA